MSYCRFSAGDVYVYATGLEARGGWTCCCCLLDGDFVAATRSEMIAHLEAHDRQGHATGDAIQMLRDELAEAGETTFLPGHGVS